MNDIYYAIIGISLSVMYIFYVIIERLLINYYRKNLMNPGNESNNN